MNFWAIKNIYYIKLKMIKNKSQVLLVLNLHIF